MPKRVCFRAMNLISDENPFTFYTEVTPPRLPGGLEVSGFENRFRTHCSSGFAKSFFLATELQWISTEPGTRWKRLFQVILHRTLLSTRILWSALNLSLHPPLPPDSVKTPNGLISTHFAQSLTLFGVGGGRSPVLLISLGRSQHFWCPSLSF